MAHRHGSRSWLLTLGLVLGTATEAPAWGETVHNNIARLTAAGTKIRRSGLLLDAMLRVHQDLLVEGSHEPDEGRSNLFLQASHRYDATQRAANAFCAAANILRRNGDEAIRHLGHSFHYLQDLGDPTKELTGRRHKYLRWLADRLSEEVLLNPPSLRAAPIQSYVEYENRRVNIMSFTEVRHYLASSRALLGKALRHSGGENDDIDLLLRALATNISAMTRTVVLLSESMRSGAPCDTGEYQSEQRRLDREQYYVVRISGHGYVTHYSGSDIFAGYEDRILTVPPGETVTVAMHRLKQELRGDPCHQPIAAAYGPQKRPQFWEDGPNIVPRAGPETKAREIRRYRLENTWKRVRNDGPGIRELKRRNGCR